MLSVGYIAMTRPMLRFRINVTAIPDKNTTAIASTTSKSSGIFVFFYCSLCFHIFMHGEY